MATQPSAPSQQPAGIARGRTALAHWEAEKPDNYFEPDANLQRVLQRHLSEADYGALRAQLRETGRACAREADPAAARNDQLGNQPRLERFDGVGQRVEDVAFHPSHDIAGRVAYGSGIMAWQREPGHTVEQFGLFYLLNECGEMGHTCPIACTAGLIKVLQKLAAPELRDRYLPKLLDPNYETRWHGAQFLTEVQGGSDVGANACVARDAGDGTWRVRGEKWFCSNVSADLAVITARPAGAPAGTAGLGLFLVPRFRDDRTPNFAIRRLKDKIGTRTLATAEVDFDETVAHPLGPLDEGFKHMVELVLNTSRLFNACSCAGFLRRAWVEAAGFAQAREAFGRSILGYPLVQERLASIKADLYATTASTFQLAHLLDRIEAGQADGAERGFFRLAVNANKTWTSLRATQGVHDAIEVLGGNGAIEEFSILPRLYRDAVVLESWEGAHNVLCAQILRDAAERGLTDALWTYLDRLLEDVSHPGLAEEREQARGWIEQLRARFERLTAQDAAYAQAHMRRWVEHLAATVQALCLLRELDWEKERAIQSDKRAALAFHAHRFLTPGYAPEDDADYLARLSRLSGVNEG